MKKIAMGPTYCLSCKKRTFNDGTGIDQVKVKGRWYHKSVCKVCGSKKSLIIKKPVL